MDTEESGEMIKQQMHDTRSSLADKLETLEQQVADTVETATTAVTETVESVKEVVHDTVESVQSTVTSVKEAFDIRAHVDRHPWAMMGGCVALGYLGGYLLSRSAKKPAREWPPERSAMELNGSGHTAEKPANQPMGNNLTPEKPGGEPSPESGPVSALAKMFAPEVAKLRGLAIGTLLGSVRDMVAKAAPVQLGTQLVEVLNNVTEKLGGEVIQGPDSKNAEPGSGAELAPEMAGPHV